MPSSRALGMLCDATPRLASGSWRAWRRVEDGVAAAALIAMALVPVTELLLRGFLGAGIPGAYGYLQHLTLWAGFAGALVAARRGRHLALSTERLTLPVCAATTKRSLVDGLSALVAAGLAWAAYQFVLAETANPTRIGGWLPLWVAQTALPLSFGLIAVRFALRSGGWRPPVIVLAAIAAIAAAQPLLVPWAPHLVLPGLAVLGAGALLGAPIFVLLGGAAMLLFFAEGVPIAAIPVETYRIAVSPAIPAIPLFTLAGYLLTESKAGARLLRLFHAWIGWLPGGLAVATVIACAFFTTFTGASGVMILALGGLLLPMLTHSGYGSRFSTGLITASGSIGLLLPPSLAVILYGVMAHVSIVDVFKGGLLPGLLMVAALCLYGVYRGLRAGVTRSRFDAREALTALWAAKWEVMIPLVVLAGVFGGVATLVEAAAVAVAYVLFVEVVVHREIGLARDLPRILVDCATLVGGVFMILGVAMGVTNYLVDAEVPTRAAEWVETNIGSRLLFLLILNVALLAAGCLMDLFSAIVVVVPLILPMAAAFDVHPVHLGIIFLANLELGYLTPPVGLNLFLAAYRFEKSPTEIFACVVPYFLILLVVVLLITYVPALSLAFLPGT